MKDGVLEMAWITLSLRKQNLKSETNELELRDITLSREKRSIERNLAYQKSVIETEEDIELKNAKAEYDEIKKKRPMQSTVNGNSYYFATRSDYEKAMKAGDAAAEKAESQGKSQKNINKAKENAIKKAKVTKLSDEDEYKSKYDEWKEQYNTAKENYEEQSTNTKDYYDDMKEEIEEEATDKQTQIEEEQTIVETNLQDLNQELSSISEQIGTDVQSSAIKFQ